MHACSAAESSYGSAQSIVGRCGRAAGACRARRDRRCPPARSIRCSRRAMLQLPVRALRRISCPSSLNCMIAMAFCIRASSSESRRPSPLRLEALGGVVAVDLARQLLERRDRDAVALLELREPAVAQRDAHHRRDRRLMPETRAHPRGVVVAPGDRDVRLLHQQIDHLVDPRAAVAEVAGDDQLADREVAHDARDQAQEIELVVVLDDRLEQRGDVRRRALQLVREHQLAEHRVERIGMTCRHAWACSSARDPGSR